MAAIGVRPNTEWLGGTLPLTARRAVPVDLAGRVAGGPATVRAVGDCADRTSPRDGVLPGAHWDGALNHPAAVAAGLLGEPAPPADPAPPGTVTGAAILTEAALSFLGLGVPPAIPTRALSLQRQ